MSVLEELRSQLKARTYRPSPTRERGIPKRDGKVRYLGIPTIRDRVVQMALKLVLEPIFETDFYPASYGYRPARRAQDAIAEIVRYINPRSSCEYVVEGEIKECFDNVRHRILMRQIRRRISDRRDAGVATGIPWRGSDEGDRAARSDSHGNATVRYHLAASR